jgi:hypothetical protein
MMKAPWHPASEPPKQEHCYLVWLRDVWRSEEMQEIYAVARRCPGGDYAGWDIHGAGYLVDHPEKVEPGTAAGVLSEKIERYKVLAWAKLPEPPELAE